MNQRSDSSSKTKDLQTSALLLSIARCPEIMKAFSNPDHLCHSVVSVQQRNSLRDFQLPEPWNGYIDHAPLLFVSSNPGYGPAERYPTGDESWSDDAVVDFFMNRFGDGQQEWIRNGNRALQTDGSYSGQNVFWPRTRAIAADLFGRGVIPGYDYAITEVVHCKSDMACGVTEAGRHCTTLHLDRILAASPARVVVVFGKKAKPIFQDMYPTTIGNLSERKGSTELTQELDIAGRKRLVIFHQHPSAHVRYLSKWLSVEGFARVRNHLVD